ncbi:MAG: CRISPR-associated endonuclease Cas1, partial [Aeriscardovia sp.]|nr:CRISPR-associated endonuclease Cas1 [Aeriscardovia sp.]
QGNPLSPLLSNVFLNSLDHELESEGVSFYRYSDDINAYFSSMDLALGFKDMIEKLLTEKGLTLNHKKGGVFKAVNRKCLGYEFVLVKGALIVQKSDTSKRQIYNKWHREPIKKIDDTYHLVSDGVVTRRDFTLLFQNDETKHYLPIETIHSLNIYSNITFSSGFFEYAGNNGLSISIVNNSGELVGRFLPAFTKRNYKTELLQVSHRENERESLALAKKYQNANIFNLRAILRYYERRGAGKEITETVEKLTTLLQKTNETKDIRGLLILEAQARQMYYRCFNTIISKSEYKFEKRTKRPPKDPINAMISFGNTILYNLFATFIYHSSLDIRFGILHNSFHRPESLNLDLADLFKPVIVDRSIFTVINRNMIDVNRDFVEMENGAVYLSKHGKRIFIKEIENKLEQKVKIKDTQKTYRTLMVEEVGRVESYFRKGETYKPYKYVN